MTKLAFVLALTTVAFAASTAWLVRELSIERGRVAALSSVKAPPPAAPQLAVAAPPPAVAGTPPSALKAVSADSPPSKPAPAARVAPDPSAMNKAIQLAYARDALEQLTDPARRRELIARVRAQIVRANAGVAQKVGLTPEDEARLIDLLVDQQLKSKEVEARCELDLGCPSRDALSSVQESAKLEQAALLGPERFERFTAFRAAAGERVEVRELRSRLPEGQGLSDAQADELALSLASERHKFNEEAQQRGDEITVLGLRAGSIATAVPHDAVDGTARRIESASEFSRRIRERAAAVLTARQMETFNQMQDELVEFVREESHREEVIRAAQRGGAPR